MKTWQIWSLSDLDLPALYIGAESFDKAIALARELSPEYNVGMIFDKEVEE